jgi:hypothetical protein
VSGYRIRGDGGGFSLRWGWGRRRWGFGFGEAAGGDFVASSLRCEAAWWRRKERSEEKLLLNPEFLIVGAFLQRGA